MNFKSGRGFGYDFAWDIVFVFHIFLISGLCGGSGTGVKECFGSWDYWLLVVHSCELEADMVNTVNLVLVCLDHYIENNLDFLCLYYSIHFLQWLKSHEDSVCYWFHI